MDNPIISLKQVCKSYDNLGHKLVIDSLSLDIKEGEFFCLVGPSGCGKSTVLKLIAGLETTSSGEIIKPVNVGMVFQSGALFPWLTVEDNIAFGLKMQSIHKKIIQETVHKYLEMVKLTEFRRRYPSQLSGGQKQRVGIARALAIESQVLLLDEPFSALDPITTEELHQDLLKIWQETGKTVVLVSHSLEEAVLLSDQIGVLVSGQLKGVVKVDLPRPRHNEHPEFFVSVNKIKRLFSE